MQAMTGAAFAAALLAATPVYAEEQPSRQRDWQLSVQNPGFTSGGEQGSYYFQTTPGAAFNSYNGTRGFTDLLIAQPLSIGRDLGMGNVQATFGARVAEPLIANGFTPSLEQRRYLGVGPRVGLQGSTSADPNKINSWVMEWQVGASMQFGQGMLGGSDANSALPNYAASAGGSVVNVDGLLGLSYWFDSASKFTLSYRADAHFKDTTTSPLGGVSPKNPDRVDHGPMVRFTIQK